MSADAGLGVGRRLRAARQAALLTLEELADGSGVSVRAISDLERGLTRKPRPRTVRLLAAALDLPDLAGPVETARGEVAGQSGYPVPAQLPPGPRDLIGRSVELARMSGWLDERGS